MTKIVAIAKVLATRHRYSLDDITKQLKIYNSVDLIIEAMCYADRYFISFEEACLNLHNGTIGE